MPKVVIHVTATDDLLEPLLSFLDQLESDKIKKLYTAQFNLKERLQLCIKQLSYNDWFMDTVCRELIKKPIEDVCNRFIFK